MNVPGVEYHIVRSIGNFCFGPSEMQSSADEAGIDVQRGFSGVGRKTAGVQQGTEIVEVRKFTTTIPEVLSFRRYFVDRLREDGLRLRGRGIRHRGICSGSRSFSRARSLRTDFGWCRRHIGNEASGSDSQRELPNLSPRRCTCFAGLLAPVFDP
jgi:hypothetical protein